MTDEQLAALAQQGDEAAEETLLEKYKPLVRSRARALFLAGGEKEDLLQEGMLGLFKAIRRFDAEKEASFSTFAHLLISRQMLHAIESAGRQKHRALNRSVSMETLTGEQADAWQGTAESPEAIVVDLENARELRQAIDAVLSPLEKEVLDRYLQGEDYLQIASQMERPVKSIDNALQRIRGKVARLLSTEQTKKEK